MRENEKVSFLDFLLQTDFIKYQQYHSIDSEKNDEDLYPILLEFSPILTLKKVDELRSQFLLFPQTDLEDVQSSMANLLPESIVYQYRVLAFREEEACFHIALANPLNIEAIDKVSILLKKKIKLFIVKQDCIDKKIFFLYRKINQANYLSTLSVNQLSYNNSLSANERSVQKDYSPSHTEKLLNAFLEDAANMNASDIHIEAQDDRLFFRYRLNGNLLKQTSLSSSVKDILLRHILSRSNGDISALYLPQDTAFSYETQTSQVLHIRVSTVYSINGYSIVMRLLRKKNFENLDSYIKNLKLSSDIKKFIEQRNGMFIVSGPTGSGKTTMLYHILQHMVQRDHSQEKIMTIEDPVEVMLPGITQVQVNEKIGLDFDQIIKVSLRQNPDVLMLGEIRDAKSAMMAMRASITGVMVFATIHSRTSEEVIFRLRDLGVPMSVIANSLKFVVSTRLIKKLCVSCKANVDQKKHFFSDKNFFPEESLEYEKIFSPVGCSSCHFTGYEGFIPVYEFFSMTEHQHHALAEDRLLEFKELLVDQVKNQTLFDQVYSLWKSGVTSFEEVSSVMFMKN